MKLNLGCGTDHKEGYINVDISTHCNPDKVWDLRKRIPLKGDSVSEIRAYNIVEHLEVKDIMKEFYRVLKKGGLLDILCPCPEA
ncbi:MAG: methyltransferase domain-containing protein [Candidatus Aminicenantales bacterium]